MFKTISLTLLSFLLFVSTAIVTIAAAGLNDGEIESLNLPDAQDMYADKDYDGADIERFASAYGSSTGDPRFDSGCDFGGDGAVNMTDFVYFASLFGKNELISPEAEGEIGPEGGIVEVIDTDSELYGIKVEISEGTFSESQIISIQKATEYSLPMNAQSNGPAIELLCSNQCNFNLPVNIIMPVDNGLNEGSFIGAYSYNEDKEVWTLINSFFNSEQNTIQFSTNHSSIFKAVALSPPPLYVDTKAQFEAEFMKQSYSNGPGKTIFIEQYANFHEENEGYVTLSVLHQNGGEITSKRGDLHYGKYRFKVKVGDSSSLPTPQGMVFGNFIYEKDYDVSRDNDNEIDIEFLTRIFNEDNEDPGWMTDSIYFVTHTAQTIDGGAEPKSNPFKEDEEFFDPPIDILNEIIWIGFDWYPDKVIFLVGKDIKKMEEVREISGDGNVPKCPGRLFFNSWSGEKKWGGDYPSVKISNEVHEVSYTPDFFPDSDIGSDCDGIENDGDGNGVPGDNPCVGGDTENCDDNCPDVCNPYQTDTDNDKQGDVCDPDDDNDGHLDESDAFPKDPNEWEDNDGDGVGDNADLDDDNDEVLDDDDLCENTPAGTDVDEHGCPLLDDKDTDGDGIKNDGDNNGVPGDNPCTGGDTENCDDNCPTVPNSDQADSNNDRVGDACSCWGRQDSPIAGKNLRGVDFIDRKHGWIVGEDGTIMRTLDGGKNWSAVVNPIAPYTVNLNSVDFVNENVGWCVGEIAYDVEEWQQHAIFKSTDGGLVWQPQTFDMVVDIDYYLTAIQCLSETECWVSGYASGWDNGFYKKLGYIRLHTTDGGQNWQKHSYAQEYVTLNDVFFLNTNEGWMVGDEGFIIHTGNGGTSWVLLDQFVNSTEVCEDNFNISSVFFTSSTEGWISGSQFCNLGIWPVIYHTTNGGQTWSKQYEGLFFGYLSDLVMISSDVGWAFGGQSSDSKGFSFVSTKDGGSNWIEQDYVIQLNDGGRGDGEAWAVGEDDKIIHYPEECAY
nr:YCF48-related protein [uncultured Desulfobacter sp.]